MTLSFQEVTLNNVTLLKTMVLTLNITIHEQQD